MDESASDFAKLLDVPFYSSAFSEAGTSSSADHFVHFATGGYFLSWPDGKRRLSLKLDFASGANAHRRKYGGGKNQMLAKAVGINTKYRPSVLDCTAGQGGDAFVLAGLGCEVTMLERSPVAHLLLDNALSRAMSQSLLDGDNELLSVMQRLTLRHKNAIQFLVERGVSADVIYLDPMFPERKKKAALVKKEMRVFHDIIGADDDADALLEGAMCCVNYRVVVKRPKTAPFLADRKPTYQLQGKSTRFDIYVIKALPS